MKTPASLSMPDAANSPNLEKWTDFELFNSCLSTLVHSPLKDHQLLWPFLFHYWSVWPFTPFGLPYLRLIMTACVCVFVCVSVCVWITPRGQECVFPMTWSQTKQPLSPPRHPPVILSRNHRKRPKKHGNTHTHARTDGHKKSLSLSLPFHFLFFCLLSFLSFSSSTSSRWKMPCHPVSHPSHPLPLPLCAGWMRRRENKGRGRKKKKGWENKSLLLDTKGTVPLPGNLRKRMRERERERVLRGGGREGQNAWYCAPPFWLFVTVRATSCHSSLSIHIQRKANILYSDPTWLKHTRTHTQRQGRT